MAGRGSHTQLVKYITNLANNLVRLTFSMSISKLELRGNLYR